MAGDITCKKMSDGSWYAEAVVWDGSGFIARRAVGPTWRSAAVDLATELKLSWYFFQKNDAQECGDHVFIRRSVRTEASTSKSDLVCRDCKGSCQYVGLKVIEPCATCGGTGLAPVKAIAASVELTISNDAVERFRRAIGIVNANGGTPVPRGTNSQQP